MPGQLPIDRLVKGRKAPCSGPKPSHEAGKRRPSSDLGGKPMQSISSVSAPDLGSSTCYSGLNMRSAFVIIKQLLNPFYMQTLLYLMTRPIKPKIYVQTQRAYNQIQKNTKEVSLKPKESKQKQDPTKQHDCLL